MLSVLPSGLIMYVLPCLPSPSHPTLDSLDFFATGFPMKRCGAVDEGHGENMDRPSGGIDDSKEPLFNTVQ